MTTPIVNRKSEIVNRCAYCPAATAATLAENEQARQRIRNLELTITRLQNRLDRLTAAARELCFCWDRAGDSCEPKTDKAAIAMLEYQEALRALAEQIDYPGWYQL